MRTISLALLCWLVWSPVAAAQTAEPPQLVVNGEGIVKATPDQAWVSIGAESRSKISKDALQSAVKNAMAATADASTPVAAGEIEIRAQVRLTVAIK